MCGLIPLSLPLVKAGDMRLRTFFHFSPVIMVSMLATILFSSLVVSVPMTLLSTKWSKSLTRMFLILSRSLTTRTGLLFAKVPRYSWSFPY